MQCLLFYREGETLAGTKRDVYVILKILKKCTAAEITSFKVSNDNYSNPDRVPVYQMKYGVDRSLAGARYKDEDVGVSLQRVLRYWSLRDKFSGIHPSLKKMGIARVEVTSEGLHFIRYGQQYLLCIPHSLPCSEDQKGQGSRE